MAGVWFLIFHFPLIVELAGESTFRVTGGGRNNSVLKQC